MDNAKLVKMWLDNQIFAWELAHLKLPYESFGNVTNLSTQADRELHISGAKKLGEIIDAFVAITDWDGNASCNTNHNIAYFYYRGFKVFELLHKEETEDDGE